MTTEKSIRKHVIQYLCDKGYDKSQIKENYKIFYLDQSNPYAYIIFDIAALDENGNVCEFYEIKTKGVTSGDLKKHSKKFEILHDFAEYASIITRGALGFLVTYDSKKKDFELYLITEEISSLAKYVEVVMRVASTKSGFTNYYRGQGNIEFSLLPGLYRKPSTPAKELELYKEATRRCPDDFQGLNSTFQHLVKLQHYGIPTRLLDLTSNALIALYFAVEKKEYKVLKTKKIAMDAVVFVFTVDNNTIKSYDSDAVSVISNLARVKSFEMPKTAMSIEDFNNLDDTCLLLHEIRYEKPHFQPVINPTELNKTLCVKPKLDNSRIRHQSGAFFLYGIGGNKNSCSSLAEHPINIVIESKYKDKLKKELACFGITDSYVYPEMDHVMSTIKEEYKV